MDSTPSRTSLRAAPVLVVEDDPSILKLVTMTLRRAQLTVMEAHDGAEAIDQLLITPFRAVVMDLMMPRVSGWDVVDWLKEHPDKRPRSVIIVTAADRQVFSELDPQIVNAIIMKPFDPRELAGYVRACCEGPATTDRRRRRLIGQA